MSELKKELGFWQVFALVLGSLVGSGFFFGSSIAAGYAGNLSIIAWAILGLISVYISSLFGELVALFPKAGGAYEYSKQAYGRPVSFIIGWLVWLVANIEFAMLILVALDYLISPTTPYYNIIRMAISILFILLMNYITYLGIEASSVTLITFSAITISVAIAVIIPGAFRIQLSNFSPFFTHPISSIFLTMFFLLETYFGWEAATFLAEETKEPERVVPRALVLGSATMAIMGLLLAFVSLGMFGWQFLSGLNAPLATMAESLFGETGRIIIGLGVYFTMMGSAAVGIITTPRLIYALARDRLFLSQMVKIHPTHKTPYNAIIFQTIVGILMLFIGMGKYQVFLSLVVPLSLIMYIPIILAVTILRFKKPFLERKFKAPFGVIGPILISIFFIFIIWNWLQSMPSSINLFLLGISLTASGIPVYFLLQLYYNPKAIILVNDFFAYLAFLTENYFLPRGVRDEILELLGNIKDKKVLEFGCGVGTLTMHLAEAVTKKGRVYATDISEREIKITRGRLKRAGHEHVIVLHEKKDSIHRQIKKIDAAVSVAALGYIQDLKYVLKEINSRLKKHGRIVFLEYDKFFWILPNIEWLSDDNRIKEIFRECGFYVQVERKQGLFWQYIYIYGNKIRNEKNPGIIELKEPYEA
ncbi:MAG: amino acid permease [Candidatus Woesearchaeota archaeon]